MNYERADNVGETLDNLRADVIKNLVSYASSRNSEIVLDGLTALYLFYGLDKVPSEVDFITSGGDIEDIIKAFCKKYDYHYDLDRFTFTEELTLYYLFCGLSDEIIIEHRTLEKQNIHYEQEGGIKYCNLIDICSIFIYRYQLQRDDDKYVLEDIYAGLYVINHFWNMIDNSDKIIIAEGVAAMTTGQKLDYMLEGHKEHWIKGEKLKADYKALCDYIKSPDWLELVERVEDEWGVPEVEKIVKHVGIGDTDKEYTVTSIIQGVLGESDDTMLSGNSALWYCYDLDRVPSTVTFVTSDEGVVEIVKSVCEQNCMVYKHTFNHRHRDVVYVTYGENKYIKVDVYKETPEDFAAIGSTRRCGVKVGTVDAVANDIISRGCAKMSIDKNDSRYYDCVYIAEHCWNRLSSEVRNQYRDYFEICRTIGETASSSERSEVIKDMVQYINSKSCNFVLNSYAALYLCYGLDRVPYNVEFISKDNGHSIREILVAFCEIYGYQLADRNETSENYKITYNDKGGSIAVIVEESSPAWDLSEVCINNIRTNDIMSIAGQFAIYRMSFGGMCIEEEELEHLYVVVFICKKYYKHLGDAVTVIFSDCLNSYTVNKSNGVKALLQLKCRGEINKTQFLLTLQKVSKKLEIKANKVRNKLKNIDKK